MPLVFIAGCRLPSAWVDLVCEDESLHLPNVTITSSNDKLAKMMGIDGKQSFFETDDEWVDVFIAEPVVTERIVKTALSKLIGTDVSNIKIVYLEIDDAEGEFTLDSDVINFLNEMRNEK